MTCAHVLGLIDAGPLAGYPPAHLAAARKHAETCPECGPALAMAGDIAQGLVDWPEVAPPADLAAVVMARLARVDEARATAADAMPARAHDRAATWAGVATALGGLTAGAALAWAAATGGASLIRVAGPGLGAVATGGAPWPATLPEGLMLAASLGLYVVGLFAPVAEPVRASESAASR
jgi:hypothetical protein